MLCPACGKEYDELFLCESRFCGKDESRKNEAYKTYMNILRADIADTKTYFDEGFGCLICYKCLQRIMKNIKDASVLVCAVRMAGATKGEISSWKPALDLVKLNRFEKKILVYKFENLE
jgi:hypothetical protein